MPVRVAFVAWWIVIRESIAEKIGDDDAIFLF